MEHAFAKKFLVLGALFLAAAPLTFAGGPKPDHKPGHGGHHPAPAPHHPPVPPHHPPVPPVVIRPVVPAPVVVERQVYTEYPVTTTTTVVASTTRINGGEFFALSALPAQAEIAMTTGNTLVFSLEENGTTGYQWEITGNVGNVIGVAVAHQEANGNLAGAPGSVAVRITAQNAGEANLVLRYKRSWENTFVQSFPLRVVVNPAVIVTAPAPVVVAPAPVVVPAPVPVPVTVPGNITVRKNDVFQLEMIPGTLDLYLANGEEIEFYLEERDGFTWNFSGSRLLDVDIDHNKNRKLNDGFGTRLNCAKIEVEGDRRGSGYATLELRRDNEILRVVNVRINVH